MDLGLFAFGGYSNNDITLFRTLHASFYTGNLLDIAINTFLLPSDSYYSHKIQVGEGNSDGQKGILRRDIDSWRAGKRGAGRVIHFWTDRAALGRGSQQGI